MRSVGIWEAEGPVANLALDATSRVPDVALRCSIRSTFAAQSA
jgi:hypothetical protein